MEVVYNYKMLEPRVANWILIMLVKKALINLEMSTNCGLKGEMFYLIFESNF